MYDKLGIDRKGKQIDHVKPLEAGGKTNKSNLKLISVNANEKKNLHKKGEKN
jgi:5-methylcytosine-specific restriction endonuclease McrA